MLVLYNKHFLQYFSHLRYLQVQVEYVNKSHVVKPVEQQGNFYAWLNELEPQEQVRFFLYQRTRK